MKNVKLFLIHARTVSVDPMKNLSYLILKNKKLTYIVKILAMLMNELNKNKISLS
jgi:hypothetical protein